LSVMCSGCSPRGLVRLVVDQTRSTCTNRAPKMLSENVCHYAVYKPMLSLRPWCPVVFVYRLFFFSEAIGSPRMRMPFLAFYFLPFSWTMRARQFTARDRINVSSARVRKTVMGDPGHATWSRCDADSRIDKYLFHIKGMV
jgi:hypothetical protein